MNDVNSIYEVTRNDYKGFVEQIKPECRKIKTEQIDKTHSATKIFSTTTGKCLCSRLTYTADYGEQEPERYYIFEMPEDDERCAPTPHLQITLNSKEEVQQFFDALAKLNKEKKND